MYPPIHNLATVRLMCGCADVAKFCMAWRLFLAVYGKQKKRRNLRRRKRSVVLDSQTNNVKLRISMCTKPRVASWQPPLCALY